MSSRRHLRNAAWRHRSSASTMPGGGVVDGICRWLRRHGRTASAYQPHPSGDGGLEVVPGPFTLPARTSPLPPPSDGQLKKEVCCCGLPPRVVVVARRGDEVTTADEADMSRWRPAATRSPPAGGRGE
ncbi:Os02g0322101 [Oryza sativa Japonica Group]|nr:hypothetical protein [Oryza sativa Japonica Group]BAS78387.1 Os02g0322101 [Oryza sativa Japonica Group]